MTFIFHPFFFLRKISPELTTASPPFLLRKTGPELTSVPIFLYFICGTPTTAWLDKRCHVHTRDPNQRTPGCQSGTCELNRCATRLASKVVFICWLMSNPSGCLGSCLSTQHHPDPLCA